MAAALALLVVATTAGVAHALTPNLQFNVTYNAIDPILQYVPNNVVTNNKYMAQLWNMSFSDTPWSSYVPGMVGQGTPSATVTGSSDDPPTGLVIKFSGVAAYFYGTVDNFQTGSIGVSMDGNTKFPEPQGDFLGASFIDPSQSIPGHSAVFGVFNGVITHLKAVVLTWYVETTATDMASIATTENFVKNGAANPLYQFQGGWSIGNTLGDNVGGQTPMTWDHIIGGNLASVTVAVPRNTSFFSIQGAVGPDQGRFHVTSVPGSNLIDSSTYTTYNPWRSPATLFAAPLDPNVEYNVTLKTWEDGDVTGAPSQIRAQGMTFYTSTKPRPVPKKTPIGAIVGGVIGGIGALILAGIAIFFLRKRRRRLNREEATTFVVDEEAGSKTTPFPHQAAPVPPKSAVEGYTTHAAGGYAGHELYTPLLSGDGVTSPTNTHQSLPPGAYAASGSGNSQGENAYLNPRHQSADFSSASSSTGAAAAAAAAGMGAYGFSDEKRRLSSNADRSHADGPGSPMSGTASPAVPAPPPVAMPTPTHAWPVMEEDAGMVPMGATLPPSYNPAWQQARVEPDASSSVGPSSNAGYLSPSTSHAAYEAAGGSGSTSVQHEHEPHTPSPGHSPIPGPSAAGAAFPVDEKNQPTREVESPDAAGRQASHRHSIQSSTTSERRHSENHQSPGRPMGPRTSKKMTQ